MKISSVIFLFIAVLLIVGGLFAMKYGRNAAPDDTAIDGYSWSEDGNNTANVSFAENEINKVALSLSDCDVEVIGNSEKSYAELNNFKPNTYIAAISGKTVNISDDISIVDYLSFDGSGVKFSGVWQTLLSEYNNFRYGSSGNRSVVIYVNRLEELKQINLTLNKCTLRLNGITGNCDIKINAVSSQIELTDTETTLLTLTGEKSTVTLINATTGKFTSELLSGNLYVNKLKSESINIVADDIEISLIEASFRDFTADIKKGKLTVSTEYDMTSFARDFKAKTGNIIINGTNNGNSFKSDKDSVYPGSMTVKLDEGDFNATFGSVILLPVATDEDKGAN